VVAGLLNRLITASTRFAPWWVIAVIFGTMVGGMFNSVTVVGSLPAGRGKAE
jgi:hypothetical protein